MLPAAQTWIMLRALIQESFQELIQESFQEQLSATALTAGHQGYALALPHRQNAFGALANSADTDDASVKPSRHRSQH